MAGTGFGLKPLRKLDGSPYNGAVEVETLKKSIACYKGQPLTRDATGELDATASGEAIWGIAQGFEWTDASGNAHYANKVTAAQNLSATNVQVYYVHAKNMVFEVMDASGALAATNQGNNYDLGTITSGSTTTGLSKAKIGTAGASSGVGTAQLRLIRPSRKVNNTVTSTTNGTTWEVVVNEDNLDVSAGTEHAGI